MFLSLKRPFDVTSPISVKTNCIIVNGFYRVGNIKICEKLQLNCFFKKKTTKQIKTKIKNSNSC